MNLIKTFLSLTAFLTLGAGCNRNVTVEISGIVTDETSGAPVANATVLLIEEEELKYSVAKTTTNSAGYYAFSEKRKNNAWSYRTVGSDGEVRTVELNSIKINEVRKGGAEMNLTLPEKKILQLNLKKKEFSDVIKISIIDYNMYGEDKINAHIFNNGKLQFAYENVVVENKKDTILYLPIARLYSESILIGLTNGNNEPFYQKEEVPLNGVSSSTGDTLLLVYEY